MTAKSTPIERMAFFHPDGLVDAWNVAEAFAGKDGRIATVPDIMDSRIVSPDGSPAWTHYFTTSSAEYYGKTRSGVPVIAVLHGTGPLSTLEGCLEARRLGQAVDDRSGAGRIPHATFLDILDGKHGEAHVVELGPFLERYKHPFSSLTLEQAVSEPLVAARLGGGERVAAALARQASIDDEYVKETGRASSEIPRLLRLEQENNHSPYDRLERRDGTRGFLHLPRDVEDGLAYAHLLSIGQLCNMHESGAGRAVVQFNVGPHSWNDGTRFAGWRKGARPGIIVSVSGEVSFDPASREVLWVDDDSVGEPLEVLTVVEGGDLFSQYPKTGARMDTGAPRHAVTSKEPIAGPVSFETTVGGYHGFFKYDVSEVAAIAPEGANAYLIVGDIQLDDEARRQRTKIQFYRADFDRTRRLRRQVEIMADADLMVRIAEARRHRKAA